MNRAGALDHMAHAVRLALRGSGGAAPNPLVGCVIVRDDQVVGWGYHRQCGEAHAEINALRSAGAHARGATMYVTLEPCNHFGRTPPCSQAVIDAGIQRVIIGARDLDPDSRGGIAALQDAGIDVAFRDDDRCHELLLPWLTIRRLGRPWITAKWAQTIDGRIATASGHSQWISSVRSRHFVHRIRSRVDAVVTAIGTVLADDPMLTPRHCHSMRRTPCRIVIDPKLQIPDSAQLVRTAASWKTIVATNQSLIDGRDPKIDALRAQQVQVIGIPIDDDPAQELVRLFQSLWSDHGIASVMTECGGGLIGRLLHASLVDEAVVFMAPKIIGDAAAPGPARGLSPATIPDCAQFRLLDVRRRNDDVMLHYRRQPSSDD